MDKMGLQLLILNPSMSLKYLTGLKFHLSERPIIVIFSIHQHPTIVLPELEAGKIKDLDYSLIVYEYSEKPETWASIFSEAISHSLNNEYSQTPKLGIEPRNMRYLELNLIQQSNLKFEILSGENLISALRMYKESYEIIQQKKAVKVAEDALTKTLPLIKIGTSEREIANELTIHLLRYGSDPKFPFSPIVASGPNSAKPHATPTNRTLQKGDLLIIDWGASVNDYVSDITRTFVIGSIEPQLEEIYQTVLRANEAGRSAAAPGVTAGSVDDMTRKIIVEAGYGEYFIHRTGHGIGMEGHEPPYIRGGNSVSLVPGMTFTIEPGIYIHGRGGVRIEDDVLITEDGLESLTNLSRNLITLDN